MNKLQSSAKEKLNNQVHHDVHNADMNKHICDKSPSLFATPWIVNEQARHRTTRAGTNIIDIAVLVISKNKFLFEYFYLMETFENSLQVHNINDEENHFDNTEDDHGEWRRKKLHLGFVCAI